jgi:electron transport complex protein RnfG
MVLTLFAVTFWASSALGIVYEMTKGPKAAADLAKKVNAIREVVPDFDNDPIEQESSIDADGEKLLCYPAKKDGKLVGAAIVTFTNSGYAGKIKLMVGLLPDGKINDITVLEHKETPGLGQKIEKSKSDFSAQFKGKDPKSFKLLVKQDGGDVDGITAATISSRGFSDAVQRAYTAYMKARKLHYDAVTSATMKAENK